MKLTRIIFFALLVVLVGTFTGCKVHHHGRAKVIRMSDGEKAFQMGIDWYWNDGGSDRWVKNDSYTPWTYIKARPIEEKEEELNIEEEENGANEMEVSEDADPGAGGDVETDAGDASGGDSGGDGSD